MIEQHVGLRSCAVGLYIKIYVRARVEIHVPSEQACSASCALSVKRSLQKTIALTELSAQRVPQVRRSDALAFLSAPDKLRINRTWIRCAPPKLTERRFRGCHGRNENSKYIA